jgi:hypothetical protein
MSKKSTMSTKHPKPDPRPPVDALQYEKLAVSAFDFSDRLFDQMDTLIELAASICRNPAVTIDERRSQNTLLELLVSTAEQYKQSIRIDRELYQVIALDAKGIPQSRITAKRAASLLAEAAQASMNAGEAIDTSEPQDEPASAEDPTPENERTRAEAAETAETAV